MRTGVISDVFNPAVRKGGIQRQDARNISVYILCILDFT